MSQRIRGSEITIRITVDGQPLTGSFFKVKEWTSTPRTDLVEEDYLGEPWSDLDVQHHGFDFSFTIDNLDAAALDFLTDLIAREESQDALPDIVMRVTRVFRDPNAAVRSYTEIYYDAVLKFNEDGFSGRKDYVSTSFEGKAKTRVARSAA